MKSQIMCRSELDMTEQIFLATEQLIAEGGVHSLSMHKIAKEAKISAGTIYLYFKSKDELLEQLARRVLQLFSQELEKDYDETRSYFEQYRTIWWNIWHYFSDNPIMVKNIHQYFSLPSFVNVCSEMKSQSHWALFCQKAVAAGAMCDLPLAALSSLGLGSIIHLASDRIYFNLHLTEEDLECVIERTWRALKK